MMDLNELLQSVNDLYHDRNAKHLDSPDKRMLFFLQGVTYLRKGIRKSWTREEIIYTLTGVIARVAVYAEGLGLDTKDVVVALASKYPAVGCSYCGNSSCVCKYTRVRRSCIVSPSKKQLNWDIPQWVSHIDGVYGENNRKRGIDTTWAHLAEEAGEVATEHLIMTLLHRWGDESMMRSIALELSDTLSWVFALSGIFEFDNLGSEMERRYAGNCLSCNSRPCQDLHVPPTCSGELVEAEKALENM